MAILTQSNSSFTHYMGWYGDCTNSCSPFNLNFSGSENILHKAFQINNNKDNFSSYDPSVDMSMNEWSELECGKSYLIILKPGQNQLEISDFVFTNTTSRDLGRVTESCELQETPTPRKTPTPTPRKTPTPTPQPQKLEFRWHLVQGREILQVKNILKPTNSNFASRDTFSTWSTLYGFVADSSFYSLDHATWPDASVDTNYESVHNTTSFDGLNFSFGEAENSNGVDYIQLKLNGHISNKTEFLPKVNVSTPCDLFIFAGDNNDPNNSATLDNSAWPVIAKQLEATPTPKKTPTPTPKKTPTPTPKQETGCCDNKNTSVEVTNGDAPYTNGITFDGGNLTGTLCWDALTPTSDLPSTYYIMLDSESSGQGLKLNISAQFTNGNVFRFVNSNGDCYEGKLEKQDPEKNVFVKISSEPTTPTPTESVPSTPTSIPPTTDPTPAPTAPPPSRTPTPTLTIIQDVVDFAEIEVGDS